jgi:ABC-2 type transport system permease protein
MDGFPHWLRIFTERLPLTYLADAMRRIANEGVGLGAIKGDLIGLVVWGIVAFAIAVRVFSWD